MTTTLGTSPSCESSTVILFSTQRTHGKIRSFRVLTIVIERLTGFLESKLSSIYPANNLVWLFSSDWILIELFVISLTLHSPLFPVNEQSRSLRILVSFGLIWEFNYLSIAYHVSEPFLWDFEKNPRNLFTSGENSIIVSWEPVVIYLGKVGHQYMKWYNKLRHVINNQR